MPTAADIACSHIMVRIAFGTGHPAGRFLLLVTIVDEELGLLDIAVSYPKRNVAPEWPLLGPGAVVAAYLLFDWRPRLLDRGRDLQPNAI